MRTAERLGHGTVAVFADPDADAPFVRDAGQAVHIGPAALDASYLDGNRILDAARSSGADAIHPGYGFLSENADFADAVVAAGLLWIGPHAEAIRRMGSKIDARQIAVDAGVPTIPGYDASQAPADLANAAAEIGYPVLIKAAAGGGGKGIRIVQSAAGFDAALREARSEGERSFGSGAVIVERYIERARHIEVQIVGDRHGNVIDLGTRECSVQRRYQKVLEEAPAPNLSPATETGVRAAARRLAQAMRYDSAGTVEFVVDDATGEFFFLETNTRLQVEHPVTEAVTGVDLVALQLACARGEVLALTQDGVRLRGHAFEARINAEDTSAGFMPQLGTVTQLHVPDGVRWDSGIEAGSEIGPHYDPMLAKLIVHGDDRDTARRRLAAALDRLLIGGLVTNAGLHRWLLEQPQLIDACITTTFLDNAELPGPPDMAAAAPLAAAAWRTAMAQQRSTNPWSALGALRLVDHAPANTLALRDVSGAIHNVAPAAAARLIGTRLDISDGALRRRLAASVSTERREVAVNQHGATLTYTVLDAAEAAADAGASHAHASAEAVTAPFPAVVTETPVAAGDRVEAGDVVVVIEAMKMLHSLTAAADGTIAVVHVAVGDTVESNQVLVSFAGADEPGEN